MSSGDDKQDDPEDNGSGNGSGSGPGPATPSATTFLTTLGKQYCDESFRCKATFPQGPGAFTQSFGVTPAECLEGELEYFEPQLVEEGIAKGRITYNAASAQLCLDGIGYQTDCALYWQKPQPEQFPPVCNSVLLGKVANGDDCKSDFDCAANAYCDDSSNECVQ